MGARTFPIPPGVLRIGGLLRTPHYRKAAINCAEGITAFEEQITRHGGKSALPIEADCLWNF